MDSPQKISGKKHKNPLDSFQRIAKNKATRLEKSPDQQPTELFKNLLAHQLTPKHLLYLLSHAIAWKKLEEDMDSLVGKHGVQLDAASQRISKLSFCHAVLGTLEAELP